MTEPLAAKALPIAALAPPRLPRTAAVNDPAAAGHAAEEFEAVFLAQMLKPMFAEIETEPPFGGGSAEEIWRSLQVDEVGKAIARSGGIGLASVVERELLRLQEPTTDAVP